MLLAPSRLMNPNWQGLRHGEIPTSPVKQVFHSQHLQGMAGSPAGAEALQPEPVWSVLQTLQPLFSTLPQHWRLTQESRTVHTQFQTPSRGCHTPISWPFGNPNCLNTAGLSCTFSSFEIRGNQDCGHTFSFPLVPSYVGMCLEVGGITWLVQVGRNCLNMPGESLTVSTRDLWYGHPRRRGGAIPHTLPWALESYRTQGEPTALPRRLQD